MCSICFEVPGCRVVNVHLRLRRLGAELKTDQCKGFKISTVMTACCSDKTGSSVLNALEFFNFT